VGRPVNGGRLKVGTKTGLLGYAQNAAEGMVTVSTFAGDSIKSGFEGSFGRRKNDH